MSEVLESSEAIAPTQDELENIESESNSTPEPEKKQELTKEEQKAIAKLEKEFKLKVNGKEVVEKIDLNDEQRIIKALQMEKAANEAFQKASVKEKELAAMNQQLDQFFELLKSNPLAILMNPELGLNAEELANKILDMKIEDELKDPKEKELEAALKKVQEFEEREKKAKEEAEKARLEKLEAEYERELTESVTKAIEQGDLPASPYIINKFYYLLETALDHNLDISPKDLVPMIKESYMSDMRGMIGKLPDEIIEEMVTPDRIKGIRNKRIQALKEANAKAAASQPKIEDTIKTVTKEEPNNKKKGDFWKKFGDF